MMHIRLSDGDRFWPGELLEEAQLTYIVNESCIKCKYMDCVELAVAHEATGILSDYRGLRYGFKQ